MRSKIILRTRGQTIVLGVMTLLVLAVMMMLTFTLNQVVHEKIRIQSHSDSIAYSSAVIQARAFNSIVYSNRAIAAAVVVQMAIHAWMSTATATTVTLFSGAIAFMMIFVMELAQSFCPIVCFCAIHCEHAIEALVVMAKYFQKWNDYQDKVKGAESKFNTAVESTKKMVDDIHKAQNKVVDNAWSALESIPNTLKNINANRATVKGFAGANQKAFACALEGTEKDDQCDDNDRSKSSASDRSKVIQNTANSQRPMYEKTILMLDQHDDFKMNDSDFLKDIQNNEGNPMNFKFGAAYTGESAGMSSNSGAQSKNVGAGVMVLFFTTWHDGVGAMGLPVNVFSDENGGTHSPFGHDGTHDKFKGVQQEDVCGDDKNCFINFRATEDPKKDFGQPSNYAAVQYDTMHEKMSGGGRGKNAWMVTSNGTIELKTGQNSSAKVSLIPRKPGVVISKAKTYFHQLGNWQAPPNFFDPFWRAKLHPFSREEAKNKASEAGDSDGAENADSVPIEGGEEFKWAE